MQFLLEQHACNVMQCNWQIRGLLTLVAMHGNIDTCDLGSSSENTRLNQLCCRRRVAFVSRITLHYCTVNMWTQVKETPTSNQLQSWLQVDGKRAEQFLGHRASLWWRETRRIGASNQLKPTKRWSRYSRRSWLGQVSGNRLTCASWRYHPLTSYYTKYILI